MKRVRLLILVAMLGLTIVSIVGVLVDTQSVAAGTIAAQQPSRRDPGETFCRQEYDICFAAANGNMTRINECFLEFVNCNSDDPYYCFNHPSWVCRGRRCLRYP